MRKKRRRFFRDDVMAPWLTLGVIAGVWWLGANALGRDSSARDPLPLTRTVGNPATSSSPDGRDDIDRTAGPGSETAPADGIMRAPPVAERFTPTPSGGAVGELLARRLLVPVEGIDASALRSTFDESRAVGRVHEAIDILAPHGTPIVAAQDGQIVKLFTSVAGGLTVYQFDGEERYCFYYAHLDRYAAGLTEGRIVKRGETIGHVGTTGNASKGSPHLHFAIFKLGPDKKWWQGVALDPFLVLR